MGSQADRLWIAKNSGKCLRFQRSLQHEWRDGLLALHGPGGGRQSTVQSKGRCLLVRHYTLGASGIQEALRWHEPGGVLRPCCLRRRTPPRQQKVAGGSDQFDEELLGRGDNPASELLGYRRDPR